MNTTPIPLVVVDLETTGPDPDTCVPIEVGVVVYPGKWAAEEEPTLTIEQRCFPGEQLVKSDSFICAQEVHGITAADLKDEPFYTDVIEAVVQCLPTPSITVGYNIESFDLKVAPSLGSPARIDVYRLVVKLLEACPRPSNPAYLHPPMAHPMGLAGYRLKLESLYAAFLGEPLEGAHSAVSDCVATYKLLHAIMLGWEHFFDSEIPRGPISRYLDISEWLTKPPEGWSCWEHKFHRRKDAYGPVWEVRFGKYKGTFLHNTPVSYRLWMLRENFSEEVRKIVQSSLLGQ